MEFLTSESSERVIPMAGIAVMALMLLFTVTQTEATMGSMRQAFAPGSQLLAETWNGTTNVVYDVAVYTGAIPVEKSSFYAVDFPVHSHHVAQLRSQVAGASIEKAHNIPEVSISPIEMLYRLFLGR